MTEMELREFRRDIGMIFQQFSLLERESVFNNVALPMRCWKYSKDDINQKVTSLLKLVGLEDKADVRPRNLSGGQKQRVAIARALTMNPSILLCDEATSALDPNTTTSILDLLKQINQELGITIIIVTHQMEVVRQVCNRACILENGVISSIGSVKELFMDQPKALLRLLGEEDRKLPSEGKNVRIAQIINSREQGEIFASMYSDLGFIFSIVDGTIQAYEDDNMGIFTLNVPDDKYDELTNYLNEKGISWIDAEKENAEVQA
jgi:D-methionine transport system ATP-binding protein